MFQNNSKPSLPLLGETMPEINVVTTNGNMTLPNDMKGTWFVLFSHPGDFTPVCTTEFISFQNHMKDFDALGCKLIGLSNDRVFSHIKWIEWIKDNFNIDITFPIIESGESLSFKLGMIHPGKGNSTVRAVFIVDPNGILRLMLYYPQEVGRNIDEIIRAVKALQTADEQGPTPADWPNNSLFKDDVMVPAPTTLKGAKERLAEKTVNGQKNVDWWFCHKPLKK